MSRIFALAVLTAHAALAQIPPPAQQQAPRGTQQLAPVSHPGNVPVPKFGELQTSVTPGPAVTLTLEQALNQARIYSQQVYTAGIAAQLAHEDAVQAKAALFPTVNQFNQFIYTQPNGTPSGVFVSNDGPHVYNEQMIVHGDIINFQKRADYHRALAAEAVAHAKSDIATRGLILTVVQNYYVMVSAQRKLANAQTSLNEAQNVLDITQKQEQGREAAHADVVKAELTVLQRQRDLQEAQLALDKARVGFAVLLFPNYGQDYSLTDDLDTTPILPPFPEIQAMASRNSPDMRAAQALVQQQTHAVTSAQWAMRPQLSFDYFFGINANEFALNNRQNLNNLGSVAQAQLTIPVWTWGAARSKVRQAEFQLKQAQLDLTFTQRQILAELNQFYAEAQVASAEMASLRRSVDLSEESLRLTQLRYTAGEATILELVDAQTTLVQARNAYLDGLVRYRVAIANIQTLTGAF
jgi:outer membrane protein TolC